MADQPLVSAEEVAHVLNKERDAPAGTPADGGQTKSYSLRRPVAIAAGDEAAARQRTEQFAGALASILARELEMKIEVEVQGFQQQQARDAFDPAQSPKWVLTFESAKSGGVALVLDPAAALTLVELALGGTGNTQASGRGPTPLEERVMANLTRSILPQLAQRTETDLQRSGFGLGQVSSRMAAPGETVGIALLRLGLGGAERSGMLIATAGLLHPRVEAAASHAPAIGPLAARLVRVPVAIRPVLVAGRVGLSDLTRLKTGDVLQLDVRHDHPIDLRVQGETVFRGRVQRDERAVEFRVAWRRGKKTRKEQA